MNIAIKPHTSIQFPIPRIRSDCEQLNIVWPKSENKSTENCFCMPYEHAYSLEDCAKIECKTSFNVEAETIHRNMVFFFNISAGNFFVHFLCENSYCDEPHCLLQTFVISYYITAGKIANHPCAPLFYLLIQVLQMK